MNQLMLLPPTVSCFSKIPSGFTFLVQAYVGYPRQSPEGRKCVCVCVCVYACVHGFLYLRPHGVVAGGILFLNRSFFFFLLPADLRDVSTDTEPL